MAFAKLLSGRVAKVTGSDLDSDRSEYISLGNAEPDFGLPDSDNGILSSLSNGTRQFLYPGTGIAIDSGDIDVDVTTTTFNSSGFNHTSSTDLYNVIKDLDQVIGQVTGTDSSGGGVASVLTDSSIDGNGTTGSPLSLHPNVTGLTLLTIDNLKLDGNTLSSTDGSNTLYIDPAPVNDNGGTLVVKGNLQVDGTTTTVNSTTVSINDKNIVLADSAANATEADGAGITVNGANATITYNSTYDAWKLNKDLRLDDNISAYFGNGADLRIYHDGNNSRIREQGTGELRLEYSQLRLWDTSGVTNLVAYSGGGVNLYHNGSQKFGTTSDGVEIPHGQLILGDDSATVDWRIGNNSADRLIFTIQGTGGPEMELRNDSAANYQDASLYVGGNRVLTTADPGSGNALDADTVDGLHASQFLRSDSDDTATGRIYLSGGAGIGSADNASYDLYNNGTTYLNGATTVDDNLTVNGLVKSDQLAVNTGGTLYSADGNYDDIIVGSTTGNHGITIASANTGFGALYFGDNNNNNAGRVMYDHTNNVMSFYTSMTQRMKIYNDGDIIIGSTAGPVGKLDVRTSGANMRTLNLEDDSTGAWMGFVTQLGSGGYTGISSAGDMGIIFSTDDDNTTNASNGFLIASHNQTASGLKVMENGRVGINVANPSDILHVTNAGETNVRIQATATGSARLYLQGTGGGAGFISSLANSLTLATSTSSDVKISPNNTEAVRVLGSNGFVGIGTTSPGLPLDVNGTIRSNSAVRLTNTGQFTDDTATTTSTTQTVIAQWSATTFGGGKVIVEAKDGSNRHISELLITHNGTTASATEYGTVHTSGSLATYDVDISGGNVRLLATAASTNSTAYKMMNTLLFS